MIPDDIFRKELDAALKRQGLKKADRNRMIAYELLQPVERRDERLDNAELSARLIERSNKKEIPSEFKEQCDFVQWFKGCFPGVVIMSIRNGGLRHPSERLAQLMEGMHSGAADLFIPEWLCWIEFKRIKGGRWNEEQQTFATYVEGIGQTYLLAYGCADGIEKTNCFTTKRGIQ